MLINILKARVDGRVHQTEFDFDVDNDFLGSYPVKNPVKVKAEYSVSKNDISLEMEIDFCIITPCDLCLETVEYRGKILIRELVKKDFSEDDNYTYKGDSVEVDKIINDYFLLNTPSRIMCNEGCKGLCPVCGKNKNFESCNCDVSENSPFAILKDK